MVDFVALLSTFLPEVVIAAAALLVFLLDVLGVRRTEVTAGVSAAASLLALLFVVADLGIAPFSAVATLPSGLLDSSPASASTSLYAFTSLGLVFQMIFLSATFLVSLASASRPSAEPGAPTFFGLLLLASVGMLFVAVAADLIFLLLAIEITSVSTYLLVAYRRRDRRTIEAAMKFYIIGALSTVLSFFGASLLFGAFGTTNLYAIALAPATPSAALVLVGYAFLLAGLAFKVTVVPFHAWAVDVYDGAPDDVSAFLAGGTKKIGLFAFFLVFLGPVLLARWATSFSPFGLGPFNAHPVFQLVLGALAVLTMTFGNLLALWQKEIKRMLAYSSISQAGYMLIGIAIGTSPAIAGATLQIFAHVLMKTGAFLVVGAVAALGIGPLVDDWRGLGQERPYLGVAFALMLLGLAGIPLTVGFVSKFVLFSAAIQAEGYFVWLAVAGVLNSAASVFYYARVLKAMFFERSDRPAAPSNAGRLGANGLGYGRAAAIAIIAVVVVLLGIYPGPLLSVMQSAAQHFVLLGP